MHEGSTVYVKYTRTGIIYKWGNNIYDGEMVVLIVPLKLEVVYLLTGLLTITSANPGR